MKMQTTSAKQISAKRRKEHFGALNKEQLLKRLRSIRAQVVETELGCWIPRTKRCPHYWSTHHIQAHKFVAQVFCGEMGKGEVAMHSCDNKTCVNPLHLSRGSYERNNRGVRQPGVRTSALRGRYLKGGKRIPPPFSVKRI